MIFDTPTVDPIEQGVIDSINKTRTELRFMLAEGRRWKGLLARQFLARSIQGSSSIEGINFSVNDAIGALAKEPAPDTSSKDYQAMIGHREAMTYILHLADDPDFTFNEGFVRALHFMMVSYDLDSNPGRWRRSPIFVRREATGEVVYEGPAAEEVPGLVRELMERLETKEPDVPPLVRAAMAHLNLVMIHPFSDGNGRMSRALQTLVLVRERVLDPEFCSIEEYIGRFARQQYYDRLGDVGGKTWNPKGDARSFVRFCLTAHLNQAERIRLHALRMRAVWLEADKQTKRLGLPDRLEFAIAEAAFRFEVNNAIYRQMAGVDERRATRDLKLLVDKGLLVAAGERRGRSYKAGPAVEEIRRRVLEVYPPRALVDPFI